METNNYNISIYVLFYKRVFDIIIGFFGSLLFFLSFPFLALLIKLDHKGPVLYKQIRVGKNKRKLSLPDSDNKSITENRRINDIGGAEFIICKYRTMYTDAEKNGAQFWNKNDSRVTRIGKWLRLTHVDELPQFLSILKGNMSFIGPRPERPQFTTKLSKKIPYYSSRTNYIKPGLTGLAQIKSGYMNELDSAMVKSYYDLAYATSLYKFISWIKLESWIIFNTFFYLLNRQISSKNADKLLSKFDIEKKVLKDFSDIEKNQRLVNVTVVEYQKEKHSNIISDISLLDLSSYVEKRNFKKNSDFDVYLNINDHLPMEDLVFLVNLIKRIHKLNGRLSIKNPHKEVLTMLKELKIDKSINIQKTKSQVYNFLTIDVECWFHAHNLKGKIHKSTWHLQKSEVVSNVQVILELLKTHNTRATFYILGWVADNYPEVVELINGYGHEIGSHGYYHDLVYELTPAGFADDLNKSLKAIQKRSGQTVRSYRASNFSIIGSSKWALRILAEHGIQNDSSIVPVNMKRYGIDNYPFTEPHRINYHAKGKRFTLNETPISITKLGNKYFPIAGGGYFRLYPLQITKDYITSKNLKNLPAMIYVHPWEFQPDQKKINIQFISRFKHYINLKTTYPKIKNLLENFKFGAVEDILKMPHIQTMLNQNVAEFANIGKSERFLYDNNNMVITFNNK